MDNNSSIPSYLIKELYKNDLITRAVDKTIMEFDIKGAHLVAMHIINPEVYERLKYMDKESRNIEIGKMQINNKQLVLKLQELLFLFKKTFIVENSITNSLILETTKDSIVLLNKIPTKTVFNIHNVDVEFVCKGTFSSYYRIEDKSIYFDSLTRNLKIKGINHDIVNTSVFVKSYLIPLLISLEHSIAMGQIVAMSEMKIHRWRYIEPEDQNIWRSLTNQNKFIYKIGDEIIESDMLIPNGDIISSSNYKNFVMPLMGTIVN